MCFIIFMLTIYFIFIKKIINTVIDIFNFMDFYSNCYLIVLLQRRSNSVLEFALNILIKKKNHCVKDQPCGVMSPVGVGAGCFKAFYR